MKHEGIGGKYLNRTKGMTGREAEEGLLGAIDSANEKYRLLLLRHGIPEGLLRNMGEHALPHISFDDAVDMAKVAQPWADSTNPEKDFLRELRIEVADRFGVGYDEEALDQMHIYTAVGSPLDLIHGIDFFVEYENKKGKSPFRVCLDITNDPAHKKNKENIVVVDTNALGDPANDEKQYSAFIQALAADIVRNFRAQEARDAADKN